MRGPSVENLGGVFAPIQLSGVTPISLATETPTASAPVEKERTILDDMMTAMTVYQVLSFISRL